MGILFFVSHNKRNRKNRKQGKPVDAPVEASAKQVKAEPAPKTEKLELAHA